jgi:predicted nucleotidyltransferase
VVEPKVLAVIRDYLSAVQRRGIRVSRAILYGSWARGEAGPDSDIDVLIVAPEFDEASGADLVDVLWQLRASTDSRIEPLAVGEREWREDDAHPIIEIARREGEAVALP